MICIIPWKPHKQTLRALESLDIKKAYKRFRSSSSAFIKNHKVRVYIFTAHGKNCYLCNLNKADQIDHVKSVYQCFKDKDFEFCNSLENLKPVCAKCNQSKKP